VVGSATTDSVLARRYERFLTGERARDAPGPTAILRRFVFCDIVDSTACAAALGDHDWKQLQSRFHALADEKLRHFRGLHARHGG
jgi:class 3 adenylate cyclase